MRANGALVMLAIALGCGSDDEWFPARTYVMDGIEGRSWYGGFRLRFEDEHRLVASAGVAKDFEDRLRAGGFGYGDLKKALFEHYWNYFSPSRARRAELAGNLDYVNQVLADGATRARGVATKVLQRAKEACGLD